MKVIKIDNNTQPKFKAIKADNVSELLKSKRLVGLVTGRLEDYRKFVKEQSNNKCNIILSKGLFDSIKAKVVNHQGECIWKQQESILDGIINTDPNKLIGRMCYMADYFEKNPKKAEYWSLKYKNKENDSLFKRIFSS